MSTTHRVVDVVVLGVGSGGEHVARKLGAAGLRVAAVESGLVGGECPFHGCTPSKLIVRAADTLAEARRAGELGGTVDVRASLGPAAQRVRESTHDWHDDAHADSLEEAGVRLVRGHGRLAGPGVVEVDTPGGLTRLVATRGVVLNTGTEPAVPPVDGLAATPYWTNRDVLEISEAPRSLALVGGGPIGVELAQALRRFGTQVTIVEAAPRLLGAEEPEAGELLAEVLRDEGVDVRLGADLARVTHDGERFHLDVDGDEVVVERLLVATGRSENLHDIGLETVGLDPGADHVEVDERMRAGERLWAVGDITGRGPWTHVSLYQGELAVRDVLGDTDGPWADYRAVSRVTFTDPEVGAVGLTEAQAREQGIDVAVGTADIGSAPRGWIHQARGLVKVVADRRSGVVVGATTMAPYGGEVLGLLSTAVHAQVPVSVLRTMHFAYPTFHRTIEVALKETGL
ncbi:FAD-dependent oxidoreductase [Nocardioides sp. 31GB23]|uniref:Pyruvate/2-oxoglutarate dehydrogenase complex dihydrolipoamide dehydrogenase (E3) component n=1 Tax=Nocardioides salarius TaxID=374513 RepID=A0ABS2M5N7_9ACTN|nr:FAD-dependent oxidoreductase [Nocardioides salarius]MBM7506480.1 pyruvate/2-oxoglutarate dehydrogenase complex dihydrolipoamide dehydrogenase (E3) component [Nocardioides salarius]